MAMRAGDQGIAQGSQAAAKIRNLAMKTFIPAIASALFLTVGLTNIASAGLSLQERALSPVAADAHASAPATGKGGFQFDRGTQLVEDRRTPAAGKGGYQTASYDPDQVTKTVLPPPGPAKAETETKSSTPTTTTTRAKPRYQKAEKRERVRYTSEPVYYQSRPAHRPVFGSMRVMRF
jgi:hypothetical protein